MTTGAYQEDAMSVARKASQPLTPAQCLALLASVPVGRLVYTEEALPAVHPVNFVLLGNDVVINTGSGAKFAAAERGDVLAFEADHIDIAAQNGWSVLVVGHASVVRNIDELVAVAAPGSRPWAPGRTKHVIRISGERITGRRLNIETTNI
jgi:nitroimidazol reductase NimA-like FMN-containing flavoprotein (pyridoxamine 5'-phosphate oxidase superfamily)